MEGGFHQSTFQADWIKIFNYFNKNSQHLLDMHIRSVFSVRFSVLWVLLVMYRVYDGSHAAQSLQVFIKHISVLRN